MDFRMFNGELRQRGFTVIELMITIVILSIAMTLAKPSMLSAIEKRRTIAAAERIYGQLQLARLQSVARSEPVFANFSFSDPDWAMGVSNVDCDPSDNDPPGTLPDVDDAASNIVTYRITAAEFNDITVESSADILFSPQRATASAATIDVTSTGKVGYLMEIQVGMLGQISMCSPAGNPAQFVGGYRPC
jgi:prepilin-type N-terminal cleavage/methylation domain-containing protein